MDTEQVAWYYAKTGRLFGPNGFVSHLEAMVFDDVVDAVGDKKLARLVNAYWKKYESYDGERGYGSEDFVVFAEDVEEVGHKAYDRAYELGLVRIVWPSPRWHGNEFAVTGIRSALKSLFTSAVARSIIKEAESLPNGMRFVVDVHGEEQNYVLATLPMERLKFNTWLSKL